MKKVAVIGAGVAGLIAVKECLENGLQPVCFEQHDDIGGIWYYTENVRPNQGAGAFHNLITNTSKETMCFSDFPFAEHYPQYMSHKLYHQYLHEYARHYDILPHIQFNTQVVSVNQSHDYDETGRWDIVTKSQNGEQNEGTYDGVFVCIGGFRKPIYPKISGMEKFKGKIIHMHEYRELSIFKDKRVLVIGNQNSAADAATDAAHVASQVYQSVGNGAWYLTRYNAKGFPSDLTFPKMLSDIIPVPIAGQLIKTICKASLDHAKFGIPDGKNPATSGYMGVTDELPYLIKSGQVIMKRKVTHFTESSVEFNDGTRIDDVDIIVLATGFDPDFSFIECEDLQGDRKNINMYKYTFPMSLPHPTLICISCAAINGIHQPGMEVPCRLGALVLSDKYKLPPKDVMKKDLERWRNFFEEKCKGKMRVWSHVLAREIALDMGIAPPFFKLFIRDPLLALRVFLGRELPVHYRLVGPGSKPEAWDMAHKAYQRVSREMGRDYVNIFLLLIGMLCSIGIFYHILYSCL